MEDKEDNSFNIVNLPKLRPEDQDSSKHVSQLAERYRTLRLHSLKTSPEAFGSSYESEVERPLEQTLERLQTLQADHFFAVDKRVAPWTPTASDAFFTALFEARWVGMIVLIGPLSSSGSLAISSKRDPLSLYERAEADSSETGQAQVDALHYHLNGMFVDSDCRRGGLGKRLIETALHKALAKAVRRGQALHCTVLVNVENPSARKLYEKVGFRATGQEQYLQQPRLIMGELRPTEKKAVKMELWLNDALESDGSKPVCP